MSEAEAEYDHCLKRERQDREYVAELIARQAEDGAQIARMITDAQHAAAWWHEKAKAALVVLTRLGRGY